MWQLIFRLKFWSPLIWKRIKINSYDLQTHKSIIQNLNAASKMKASKTKPLVQLELLLFVYTHCNIVLLCKVPFHKILLLMHWVITLRSGKAFSYHVYPCTSVWELAVLQTPQVRLWTVSQCNTMLNATPALSEVRRIVSPYILTHKQVLERLGS